MARAGDLLMPMTTLRSLLASALIAAAFGVCAAHAQDALSQDWALDPGQSHVWMQTNKLDNVIERHQFTGLDGAVSHDGSARLKIDLNTLDTGIDLRNVRMRFVLFETFKYPTAEITAQLDKSKLQGLSDRKPVRYPLTLNVNLHGIVRQIDSVVWITRTSATTVSVTTADPIIVPVESFDFAKGVAKLSDAMGGIKIVPSASITFELVFGTGALKPELEAARAQREQARVQQETAAISTEGCETRLTVMGEANAIYFPTGSAALDPKSEPMLNSGADIANRCPAVKFLVEGHTDNVGGKRSNQHLSEARAKSVVDYLAAKGVNPSRIQSVGYGDTRPVASNANEAGRAKNRRIEFKVKKD
jgi:outer membrane protein OmpA-like peptidoglycan-associated protein/polyisoprenoid-binding protein YceI